MTEKTFPVVEVFGPTIQGEGALAGQPTHFIRFGLCDFRCAWCDSSHAVLPELVRDAERLTLREVEERIRALPSGPEWITVSGGNPAMHDLAPLLLGFRASYKIAVETQGSIWAPWLRDVDLLTVSPKPPSSTMDGKSEKSLPQFLVKDRTERAGRTVLKIVVFDDRDYAWARWMHMRYPYYDFYLSVGTKMGGLHGDFAKGEIDTRDSILDRYRWLAEKVAGDSGFRDIAVFPQLHALVWPVTERGH